jgi:hypothetical protein
MLDEQVVPVCNRYIATAGKITYSLFHYEVCCRIFM